MAPQPRTRPVKDAGHWPRPLVNARRELPRVAAAFRLGMKIDPRKPTLGIHHGVIAMALGGVALFLLAIPLFFTGNLGSDFNLLGVAGFAVIFFTLTLTQASRAAHDPRWGGPDRTTLSEFAEDNVEIATGKVSGREALVEILVLPATLGIGMIVIALVFAFTK